MKIKVISILLCLMVLCGTVLCLPISASTSYTPLSSLEGTTVSEGETYSISTKDELLKFASLCTEENNWCEGVTFIITGDIDLNEGWTASADAPTGDGALTWTPISLFKGVFDGQGNTVSGFYAPEGDTATNACGMFATICGDGAAVKELNITNSYFGGGSYVGAVCGLVPDSSTNYGIKFEKINASSTTVEAEGDSAGGIVGRVTSSQRASATHKDAPICFTECTFDGSVKANATNVGGIIGKILVRVVVTDCINNGQVESTLPYTGSSMASATVGGIIGSYTNSESGDKVRLVIKNCANNGNVFSDTIEAYGELGGILGYSNMPTNISGCVNSGEVYTSLAKTNTQIGGIFGLARNSGNVVENCVNIGSISRKRVEAIEDTKLSSKNYLGGIVGWSYDDCKITVTSCASLGVLSVAAAKTDDNSGGVTVGGILGGSTGARMTLVDCIFTGKIDARACAAGGIVGLFNKSEGILTRCISLGMAIEPGGTYNGSLIANLNNSTGVTFEDCLHRPDWRSLPTWVSFSKITETDAETSTETSYRYMSVTVKTTGKEDIVKEYKYEVTLNDSGKETNTQGINPAVVRNFLVATGAQKTVSYMTDSVAMKELDAFGWSDTESGWTSVAVGDGYIPMPKSVSALVDAEDIPEIVEDTVQDAPSTDAGADSGSENEGSEGSEDGSQDNTVELPDDFDPSLIIRPDNKDENTEDTSGSADTGSAEEEESDTEPTDEPTQNNIPWLALVIGAGVAVLALVCVVCIALGGAAGACIAVIVIKKKQNARND